LRSLPSSCLSSSRQQVGDCIDCIGCGGGGAAG
jgi:hypothetical protein